MSVAHNPMTSTRLALPGYCVRSRGSILDLLPTVPLIDLFSPPPLSEQLQKQSREESDYQRDFTTELGARAERKREREIEENKRL